MSEPKPSRQQLLPRPVGVLWFAAIVSWASGQIGADFGYFALPNRYDVLSDGSIVGDEQLLAEVRWLSTLWSVPTTIAIVLAAVGLGMLYARRGSDQLSRTTAVAASVTAIAGALAAVAILAILWIGLPSTAGVMGVQAGAAAALTTAAAAASAVVVLRPYATTMTAQVGAGIGGAVVALPLVTLLSAVTVVMTGAIALGVIDRLRAVRQPELPWSRGERTASIWLGLGAIVIVTIAWVSGLAGVQGEPLLPGPGFAVAALAAVPLMIQSALLLRVAAQQKEALTVAAGLLVAASAAVLTAPVDLVIISALGVQTLTVAIIAGIIARQAFALPLGPVLMVAVSGAIVWMLGVLPSGALALVVIAIPTTIIALRRKVSA